MNKEMDKTYHPELWEDIIYKKWEESGYFNPDNLDLPENAPNYTMVLPPPNITAKLHIGHASVMAIGDLFIRYHRLKGYRTLWTPGTDHAAIATQNVVERKILAEDKKTRHDLGKERFLEKVWEFLQETQAVILNQTKKMGASLDWSRQAFTLDDERKKAVSKMFVDMHKEGIIYRGERVVNWCPRCKSTLADDEIEYQEQKTILYTFKYDADFPMAISTTRPETKLGDTAIAINHKDTRYAKYIGQELTANFCGQELKIKIIADINVDINFGAGALGVTPAHSMIDSQMAQKNNLETIKVIDEDGNIRENFGKFSKKSAVKAREMIITELKEKGLIVKEEEIENNISTCYRCKTAIEPLPSKQWFVSVDSKILRLGNKSLKEKAIEAGESKKIEFIPDRFTKRYLDWMGNLHDWCISRQIWFGHAIPAWYKGEETYVGEQAPVGDGWEQDPDTLDTWFSSGMWTFSTLGWPQNFSDNKKTGDLAKFHPSQMLETGYEILTLWVSRMIMMSFFAIDEIPFKKVYLNGMVLDKNGKKMSKSKGNGTDPLDMIEKFGTDSLRLSLLLGNTPGNDLKMSEEKIAGHRNFINKLWNISRFIISNSSDFSDDFNIKDLSLADKWILNKLNKVIIKSDQDMSDYKFALSGEEFRDFTWNDLADWYLEAKKFEDNDNKNKVLIFVLKNILKLWHPFIPFITEVIWEQLGAEKMLMISSWPQAREFDFSKEEKDFNLIQEIIIAIRTARSDNKIEPNKKLKALILSPKNKEILTENKHLIQGLKTGLEEVSFVSDKSAIKKEQSVLISVSDIEIYLLGGIDKEKEKIRRLKEINNLEKVIIMLEGKLNNKEFVDKAPADLVKKEKEKLKNCKLELNKINN